MDKEYNYVELRGTKAGATLKDGIEIYTEKNGVLVDENPIVEDTENAHGNNIRHFVDVISNGTKPEFEPIQGLNMIKILSAIYKSAETGREVVL